MIDNYEIITYANKSHGMFEELINNTYNVPITVLGMGTKWNGFSDKYKGVLEHLKTKQDGDIIIFVDGFDTKINQDPNDVVNIFKQYNCKVLISKDPEIVGSFLTRRIFGSCKGKNVGNSGLYMGYVKYLKVLIGDALSSKCKDDQVNLNRLCGIHEFIKIDESERIFQNLSPSRSNEDSTALFVSYPGTIGAERYTRAAYEYYQFFFKYIIALLLILLYFLPKYKKHIFGIQLFCFVLFLLSDRSCLKYGLF